MSTRRPTVVSVGRVTVVAWHSVTAHAFCPSNFLPSKPIRILVSLVSRRSKKPFLAPSIFFEGVVLADFLLQARGGGGGGGSI